MTKLFLNGSSGKMGESIKKILEGNLDLKVLDILVDLVLLDKV